MKESRLTKRYAKALFDFAVEQAQQDTINADMKMLSGVCHTNRDFQLLLISPIIKADKKQNIINSLFENKINKISLMYLRIIIRKRRESHIKGIAERYQYLYNEYKCIKTAVLKTSISIDESMKIKAKEIIKKYTNCEALLIEEVKKELIGGFVLTIDDKQYDASIKNKIQKLNKEFKVNIYEKRF